MTANEGEFVYQCLESIGNANRGHIGLRNFVAGRARYEISIRQELAFHLVAESALFDTVGGQLAHVARREFPHLSSNAVFFHEWFARKVELKRIVYAVL